MREEKPPLVGQQCVVYHFQCGLCDAAYVGYTCRHLHQRTEEPKGLAGLTVGSHLREPHDVRKTLEFLKSFRTQKPDCLIFEMNFRKWLCRSPN